MYVCVSTLRAFLFVLYLPFFSDVSLRSDFLCAFKFRAIFGSISLICMPNFLLFLTFIYYSFGELKFFFISTKKKYSMYIVHCFFLLCLHIFHIELNSAVIWEFCVNTVYASPIRVFSCCHLLTSIKNVSFGNSEYFILSELGLFVLFSFVFRFRSITLNLIFFAFRSL